MAHLAVLYTREGCHLCERAELLLLRLRAEYPLEIQKMDITRDAALLEQYQYTIPVVVIDGRHRFEANKIAEHYLRRILEEPRHRWPWQRH